MPPRIERFRVLPAPVLACALIGLLLAGCHREEDVRQRATKPQGQVLDARTRVLLTQARMALQENDFASTLETLDQVDQQIPNLPESVFLRGHVALGMRKLNEARAAFEEVLERHPRYQAAWHSLGDVAYASGAYRQAIQHYRRELVHNPTPQSWYNIGNAYRMLEMPDSALTAFAEATRVDGTYAEAYHAAAEVHEQQGAFEAALSLAQKAVEHDPENPQSRFLVGTLLFELNQLEDAERMLRSALENRPWDYSTLYTLGRVLQRRGAEAEATEVLARAEEARLREGRLRAVERGVAQHADSAWTYVALAEELLRSGRLDEALARYRQALVLAPNDLSIQQNIASITLARGNPQAAVQRCESILAKDSTRVAVWVIASAAYAQLGQADRSQRAWATALRLDPTHPAIQQALQQAN